MSYTRRFHTACLLPNGKVLVAGGSGASGFVNIAEIYNPATGLWTKVHTMNHGRDYHTASILPDGTIFVVGGYNGQVLNSSEYYQP